MHFKKIAATLAFFCLPLAAHASLETWNYTDEYSSVRIESTGTCSGPFKYTNKRTDAATPGHSSTSAFEVKTICRKLSGECSAILYPTYNCEGNKVAKATITINNDLPVKIDEVYDSEHYAVTAAGSNVYVRYAHE